MILWAGAARALPVRADVIGEITELTLDNPADHWSGGTMVIAGERYILPRNLIIDYPANRTTLTEAFQQAPVECLVLHESGLARNDVCRGGQAGAQATVVANRMDSGNAIVGVLGLQKAVEFIVGNITFIDFNNGFFRVNGTPGSATAGLMVRNNDPPAVHTIQRGPGCRAGAPDNCSADIRFTEDPVNYNNLTNNGYPICIPSTVATALRTHTAAADGTGDAFCPATNRGGSTVADSTRFAPLMVGDSVIVQGNREIIAGVEFISAWSVQLNTTLLTRNDPSQPDYVRTTGAIWDVPGFEANRQRAFILGSATLPDTPLTVAVDVFSLHTDPITNTAHEKPLMSTVNNATAVGFGIPRVNFQVHYDVNFLVAAVGKSDPCSNLVNAGFTCARGGIPGSFDVLSPPTRDIIYHTRHSKTLSPGVVTRDLSGNLATQGQYLTPVELKFVDMVEVDPIRGQTPFLFEGVPWLADRRLGPGGCLPSGCESTPQPLDPFPFSGRDARTSTSVVLPGGTAPPVPDPARIFAFFPFGPNDHFATSQVNPAPRVLAPATPVALACVPPVLPAPTLLTVIPGSGAQGSGLVVAITGTGLQPGATCSFGLGISAACQVTSAGSATAVIAIDPLATLGPRNVTVTNPDGKIATLTAGFAVSASPALAPPVLVSIAPTHLSRGASGPVNLIGRGFVLGATCAFGAGVTGDCSVTPGGNTAHATVIVDLAAAPGTRDVTITNPDGQSSTALAALTIDPGPATPTAALTATVNPVAAGASTVLNFSTTNATVFTLSPGGALTTPSGSVTVTPAATTTYTLTATGAAGTATASVTVTVVTAGLPAPTANLLAAPSTIVAGSSSVLSFASTGGATAVLAPTGGAVPVNGTFTVTPSTTTTYTFLVTGPGGIASATVTVVVNPAPPPPPLFAETFSGTGSLGAAWQIVTGAFALGPTSVTGTTNFNEALVAGLSVADVRVDAVVIAPPIGQGGIRARAAVVNPRTANYGFTLANDGVVRLMRRTRGADAVVSKVRTSLDVTVPHTLTLFVTGTAPVLITCEVDGVALIHFTDTSPNAIRAAGGVLLSGRAGTQWKQIAVSPP